MLKQTKIPGLVVHILADKGFVSKLNRTREVEQWKAET